MGNRILVTGSSGLVGSALVDSLEALGYEIEKLDLRAHGTARGDVLDRDRVLRGTEGVDGIIHFAAVSRVIWGEQDPGKCWNTNVQGTRNILDAALSAPKKPWAVFVSSREVYGEPEKLPVSENDPLVPMNLYGYAKAEGERLLNKARESGLKACIIRLSNVFGSTNDHPDRVVPAFARGAACGAKLRVDGADHTFDFTVLDDVVRGFVTLTKLLFSAEKAPPPIHFVGGRALTLGQLAEMAISMGSPGTSFEVAPSRNFDVARFFGTYERARQLLGWEPRISVEEGLRGLIEAYKALG